MMQKTFLSCCLIFLSFIPKGYTSTPTEEGYRIIEDHAKLPILTPAISQRDTQKIRLDNDLEVYMVSDPETHLSGAMMSVKAGSWQDYEEHPGIAHFLEHMLFLGTKKYPMESEYGKYISEHGGQTNAFTTNTTTNFIFTINNDALEKAVARFSSFFKEPLFNPSGVSRELHAIDQEYAKNLEQDEIRLLYVLKELVDPNHPYHSFNMGNSESLSNVSRQTLENWYQQHYSANLMRLFIFSSLPLEEIRKQVMKEFSGIPNKNLEPFKIETTAFSSDLEGKYVFVEPIKDTRTLTLVWELPTKFAEMKETQPNQIVCHVLGHEGNKSLLAQLKREKLAETLACGATELGDNLELFFLQIELTEQGLRDVDQVITRCFQAIHNFKDQGALPYLFDELKKMATIEYQYQSKENEFWMLLKHGYEIHDEDLSTYPEHTKIIQRFDPESVAEILNYLTPQNARYIIMAPSKQTAVKNDHKEKWLNVEYAIKPISKELITKWKNITPHDEIDLPAENAFIPQDLRLVKQNDTSINKLVPKADRIIDNEGLQIYFAQDATYLIPKISWHIQVRTPHIAMDDPSKIVLGDLYVKFLKDALNKFSYPAKVAGLEYNIKRENNGVKIQVEGYSENANLLLEEILKTVETLSPSMEKFKIFKESLLRKYLNFAKESPLEQSVELFKSVLYQDFVTEREKAVAIRKVSFKSFQEYAMQLFDQTYVEGMLYGNITKAQAESVASKLLTSFNRGTYPKEQHRHNAVIVLPQDQGPHFLESRAQVQGNAVLLAIENNTFTFKERAAQQILMQAIKAPFFNTLRTKQQTGYMVDSFSEEIEGKLFNLFAVQSNTHDTRDLLSRFEAFIEGYLQEVGKTELTEEKFHSIKETLLQKLEEPAKNIKEMGALLNTLAFEYDGDFDWIDQRKQGVRSLSYSEFLVITKAFLGRENKRRLAILLRGDIPEEHLFSYSRARTWNVIRKISDYEER
ncbi:MAG: Protease 3 [Chlamydiae bacterium]|nr:Protease 3 [Chlamydiota bacterium]